MSMYQLAPYQEFVLQKAAPAYHIGDHHFHLLHAALGLSTELLELMQSTTRTNTIEELGDMYWYLSFASHHCGIYEIPIITGKLNTNILTERVLIEEVEVWVSLVKKLVIYTKPQVLQEPLLLVWNAFQNHLSACHIELEELEALNIAKLRIRYSTTFSPEESEARKDKVV